MDFFNKGKGVVMIEMSEKDIEKEEKVAWTSIGDDEYWIIIPNNISKGSREKILEMTEIAKKIKVMQKGVNEKYIEIVK